MTIRRGSCLLALVLAACGPAEPGSEGPADAAATGPVVDASSDGGLPDAGPPAIDAARAECPPGLPSTFGDLGTATANKLDVGNSLNVFIDLDDDPRWFFVMEFHPDRGIFADGLVPGVYPIEGDDTDVQFCSACFHLFADLDGVDGGPSLHMVALKGTLTIDSVSGDEVSGRVDDLLLSAIKVVYDEESISCTANPDGTINDVPECVNTVCLGGECGRQVELAGCETSIQQMRF